jgi:hypothetical protein
MRTLQSLQQCGVRVVAVMASPRQQDGGVTLWDPATKLGHTTWPVELVKDRKFAAQVRDGKVDVILSGTLSWYPTIPCAVSVCARNLDASTSLHANRARRKGVSTITPCPRNRFLEDDGPSIDLRHQLVQRYPVLLFGLGRIAANELSRIDQCLLRWTAHTRSQHTNMSKAERSKVKSNICDAISRSVTSSRSACSRRRK